MTPAPQHPEDNLSQTLARQADHFVERGGSPLELDQVLSRAGEIRRGRRLRASIVMAAVVVAVAVPVGITTLGADHDGPGPGPAATPTSTPTAAPLPDKSAIRLGDLEHGAAPHYGYAFENKLYGFGSPLGYGNDAETSSVARLDHGFLVAQYGGSSGGGLTASFVADEGSETGLTWPMDTGFVVSPERNVGAFVDSEGKVYAVQDGGSRSFEVGQLPASAGYDVQAVVGENCSGRSEEIGCTIYVGVDAPGSSNHLYAVSPNRDPKPVFDGFLNLAGISSDGLVAGMVSFSNEGSCWAVRDADGNQLWKTCKNSLEGFSPDGKYLLAGPDYQDGPGGGGLTILDAHTGAVVLDLPTVDNSFVSGPQWEDATHVVAPVFDNGSWAVERVWLNGHREYATQTVPDKDNSYISPFKLG